jgi:hypothetical protein
MKLRILLFAIIFLCPIFGQQNDMSFWTRSTAGSTSPIPWFMHFGDKFVVDVRHNYDAKNTAGLCLGKKFGGEALSVVPETCGYIGRIDGFGPELLVLGSKGRVSLFSQNQYVYDTHLKESFVYHWTDILVKVHKNVSLGVDWQVFKPTDFSAPTAVDIGPAAKVTLGKIYLRAWPCWSIDPRDPARRGNPTLFLGVGYVF